jgi:NADH-quinone oxidoreductase subunit N
MRARTSLESGLKYLIIGSVGSATLLYGLALVYGATGPTDFAAIAARPAVSGDVLLSRARARRGGLAFKASVAPFHQWTPDVYEGAPTPITAFMAVATKAAAFGVLLRLFDVALIARPTRGRRRWRARGDHDRGRQRRARSGSRRSSGCSRTRSSAQAGYMLAGVVVSTRLGVQATSSTSPSTCS